MTRKEWIILTLAIAAGLAIVILILRRTVNTFLKPVKGKISSAFGNRTHPVTGHAGHFHNGIDIAVAQGTPVLSPLDGEVITVDMIDDTSGGVQLRIKHAGGWITGYAHLSNIMVKPGDKVKRRQVVALSGNTGGSTGPHLHFTLTDPKGNKVDPSKYFDKLLA